ncbi:hypothetical protein BC829DRAFT_421475 [Chytridium lagenaria]|nr:hypothetical protein BC829DRAFT_421475 [Chytridium lagenaria]
MAVVLIIIHFNNIRIVVRVTTHSVSNLTIYLDAPQSEIIRLTEAQPSEQINFKEAQITLDELDTPEALATLTSVNNVPKLHKISTRLNKCVAIVDKGTLDKNGRLVDTANPENLIQAYIFNDFIELYLLRTLRQSAAAYCPDLNTKIDQAIKDGEEYKTKLKKIMSKIKKCSQSDLLKLLEKQKEILSTATEKRGGFLVHHIGIWRKYAEHPFYTKHYKFKEGKLFLKTNAQLFYTIAAAVRAKFRRFAELQAVWWFYRRRSEPS